MGTRVVSANGSLLAPAVRHRYTIEMENGIVLRGRLHGRSIELDEAIDDLEGEVEVIVRAAPAADGQAPDILEVIAALPTGTLSKDEMDSRILDGREEWARRG